MFAADAIMLFSWKYNVTKELTQLLDNIYTTGDTRCPCDVM